MIGTRASGGYAVTILVGWICWPGHAPAQPQDFPARPIRMIAGSVGSLSDLVARQIGPALQERWGQAVVVDNRPGAALTIGTGLVARAAADGYTLVMSDRTAIAAAPSLFAKLAYDPVKDLSPVSLVARTPQILVAHPSVPATSLQEFIAYVKRLPQGMDHATAGPGTANHLAGELMRQVTGINLVPVHYKGAGAATMAVIGGEVKASFSLLPIALPHYRAARIKAYAITSRERFAGAPELPTVVEAGYPDLESEYWIGVLAPSGTPAGRIEQLGVAIAAALNAPAARAALSNQGAVPAAGTAQAFATFIESETRKWSKVVRVAGIKPE